MAAINSSGSNKSILGKGPAPIPKTNPSTDLNHATTSLPSPPLLTSTDPISSKAPSTHSDNGESADTFVASSLLPPTLKPLTTSNPFSLLQDGRDQAQDLNPSPDDEDYEDQPDLGLSIALSPITEGEEIIPACPTTSSIAGNLDNTEAREDANADGPQSLPGPGATESPQPLPDPHMGCPTLHAPVNPPTSSASPSLDHATAATPSTSISSSTPAPSSTDSDFPPSKKRNGRSRKKNSTSGPITRQKSYATRPFGLLNPLELQGITDF